MTVTATDWKLVGKKGGYSFWRLPGHRDIFQATKGKPPTSLAGYFSLSSVMRMKGVLATGMAVNAAPTGDYRAYNFDKE